jgi:hypothetical protein
MIRKSMRWLLLFTLQPPVPVMLCNVATTNVASDHEDFSASTSLYRTELIQVHKANANQLMLMSHDHSDVNVELTLQLYYALTALACIDNNEVVAPLE